MRLGLQGIAGAVLLLVVQGGPGRAETLFDALALAYSNNPGLRAQRAALRAVDEGVPQALSGWRPTVGIDGEGGIRRTDGFFSEPDTIVPRSGSLTVAQPLYRGGRTVRGTSQAENEVGAGRQQLLATEQEVLLAGVIAYMDVLRDQAVVELTRNNERVLQRQLEATQDRFEVGELTRTDIAQSEARVSRATSERIQAEGGLIASRATYRRVMGAAPTDLEPAPPLGGLPATEDEAAAIANGENPDLLAAKFLQEAAADAVFVAAGALLPSLTFNGELSRQEEGFSRGSRTDSAGFSVQLSLPLYQSGSVYSQVRQAREIHSQRRLEVNEVGRAVAELVTRAWERLQTARARIRSDQELVRATQVALDGVREEAAVGARTVLDVLDAEQELLDAQVSLVRTERDEYVAAFQLRQAVGRLTAARIGLGVDLYDPVRHYDAVRNKWIGFGNE